MVKINYKIKKEQGNTGIARIRRKLRAKEYLIEGIDFMNQFRSSLSPYSSRDRIITENIRNNMM